jgi:hypothetical protein
MTYFAIGYRTYRAMHCAAHVREYAARCGNEITWLRFKEIT